MRSNWVGPCIEERTIACPPREMAIIAWFEPRNERFALFIGDHYSCWVRINGGARAEAQRQDRRPF